MEDLDLKLAVGFFAKFGVDRIRKGFEDQGHTGMDFEHTDLVEIRSRDESIVGLDVKVFRVSNVKVKHILNCLDLLSKHGLVGLQDICGSSFTSATEYDECNEALIVVDMLMKANTDFGDLLCD